MVKKGKENGTVDHLIPGFITIVVVFMLFLVYMDTSAIITMRDNVDIVSREYILKMESNGWLDDASTKNLVTKLNSLHAQDIHIENIQVSGSVSQYDASVITSGVSGPVGYANTITLDIQADIINDKSDRTAFGLLTPFYDYKLHIRKQSTAKY